MNSRSMSQVGLFGHQNEQVSEESYTPYYRFVIAPTKTHYNDTVNDETLSSGIRNLNLMAENDIAYLNDKEKCITYPHVIFTGYSDHQSQERFDACIRAMRDSSEENKIELHFTGHATPGGDGKVGMEDGHNLGYRLGIPELIEVLKNHGIDDLKQYHLHFNFRCCNSAYVPIDIRDRNNPRAIINKILQESFIGHFYAAMKKEGFDRLSVTGVRGYYFPGANKIQVGDSKDKYPLLVGTVTLDADGQLSMHKQIMKIKNIPELSQYFKHQSTTHRLNF